MTPLDPTVADSPVTEAAQAVLPQLLRDAEAGSADVVEKHGVPVAAVVSTRHAEEIKRSGADKRETALLSARATADTGERTSLDAAIATFGFDRSDLESELDADLLSRSDARALHG